LDRRILCRKGVQLFGAAGGVLSAGMLLLHPETRSAGFDVSAWLVSLLLAAGAYPVLALLAGWQAGRSRARCLVVVLGALGVGICGFVAWYLAAVTWSSVLALFSLVGYGTYQWMIVTVLAVVLVVLRLAEGSGN